MSEPSNKKLYEKVKKKIYEKYPKHSAYRSGLLVKAYKEEGGKYKGPKNPKEGLSRWFDEEWRTQEGKTSYNKKGDVFRPTKKVTKNTPTTFKELSPAQIKKAQKEKKEKGRVTKFSY